MQLKTVKTLADIPFKGIELVKTDNTITEVIVGGKLHIKVENYGIKVLIKSPGETVTRYRVEAKTEGFPTAVEHLETDYEARDRAEFFKGLGAEVVRQTVSVIIDERGEVIGPAGEPAAVSDLEIPF